MYCTFAQENSLHYEENGLWNEVEDNRYQNFNGVFLCQYFAIFKLLQDINSAKQISKKHMMKQYQKEEITVLNMFLKNSGKWSKLSQFPINFLQPRPKVLLWHRFSFLPLLKRILKVYYFQCNPDYNSDQSRLYYNIYWLIFVQT